MKIPVHQSGKYNFDVTPKIENYDPKSANMEENVEERCCLEPQEMLGNS